MTTRHSESWFVFRAPLLPLLVFVAGGGVYDCSFSGVFSASFPAPDYNSTLARIRSSAALQLGAMVPVLLTLQSLLVSVLLSVPDFCCGMIAVGLIS